MRISINEGWQWNDWGLVTNKPALMYGVSEVGTYKAVKLELVFSPAFRFRLGH